MATQPVLSRDPQMATHCVRVQIVGLKLIGWVTQKTSWEARCIQGSTVWSPQSGEANKGFMTLAVLGLVQ